MPVEIEHLPSIDSTNSELMRRVAQGDYRQVCLVTQTQTAGRGRLGRTWLSDEHSLLFSLGLPLQPKDWSGLSLVVGLVIAEQLHESIQIKWPNDLWIAQQKLAGILIETAAMHQSPAAPTLTRQAAPQDGTQRYTVIGVGLNLKAPAAAIQYAHANHKTPPAGLDAQLPNLSRDRALECILEPLLGALQTFEQQGWSPFAQRFAKRDALEGLNLTLSNGKTGRYQGLNPQGALQLLTANGLETIISHEVSTCL